MSEALKVVDQSYIKVFEALYWDLHKLFPHPFEWMGLLHQPPWYRIKMRRAHKLVWDTFLEHGFVLNDTLADKFHRTDGQSAFEDCGGAIVRKLRETFQYQTGVPYEYLNCYRMEQS